MIDVRLLLLPECRSSRDDSLESDLLSDGKRSKRSSKDGSSEGCCRPEETHGAVHDGKKRENGV